MSDKIITILIEGAGTATTASILKGLSLVENKKIRTIVTDMDKWVAGKYLADDFVQVPSSKVSGYVDFMLEVCKRFEVDLYVPIVDYGFKQLATNKARFAQIGTTVLIADPTAIDICQDKWETYKFFRENNISTPETWIERPGGGLPIFIKPRFLGRASIDSYFVGTEGELDFYSKKLENPLFQVYLEGQEFTADCLLNIKGDTLIGCVVRSRVETKGGVSVKAAVISGDKSKLICEMVGEIIKKINMPGVCNIQGFITKDGEVFFTEINTRFAGTHAFTVQAGMNSIAGIVSMFTGSSVAEVKKDITIKPNIKMVRYWNEIFYEDDKFWTWKNFLKN